MRILRLFFVLLFALVAGVALVGDANPANAGSGGLEPVWAATDSGLWRSLDNGDNWERVRNASGWDGSDIHNEREYAINWREDCTEDREIRTTAPKNSPGTTVTGPHDII